MNNITDNNNNGHGNNGGNTSVYGNNNSVSGASNNGYSSLPSRKYSYGGGENLAANRAAAGTYLYFNTLKLIVTYLFLLCLRAGKSFFLFVIVEYSCV